jgi:hypothetical protein
MRLSSLLQKPNASNSSTTSTRYVSSFLRNFQLLLTYELQSITTLLHSAGLALKTLTSSQSDNPSSTSQKREIFEQTSEAYLKTLHSVDVRMRRQIYGLEESSIIPPVLTKGRLGNQSSSVGIGIGDPEPPPRTPEERRQREERNKRLEMERVEKNTNLNLKEGGMGKLDKGWLNTRSARVERDLERDLWKKTRGFLEQIGGDDAAKNNRENGGDHDMSG